MITILVSVMGAVLLVFLGALTAVLSCGVPWGEYFLFGRYRVLPTEHRVLARALLFLYLFATMVILQRAGFLQHWFNADVLRAISFVLAFIFALMSGISLLNHNKRARLLMSLINTIIALVLILLNVNFS